MLELISLHAVQPADQQGMGAQGFGAVPPSACLQQGLFQYQWLTAIILDEQSFQSSKVARLVFVRMRVHMCDCKF